MRLPLMACLLCVICGCATVQVPDYIKADHPYVRKMHGDYGSIVAAVRTAIVHNGWTVEGETNPTVYERAAEKTTSDNKDILLFSSVKQHSMILYSSYTHLNVFIHAIEDGAEVEIRYGKLTPLLVKQFSSTRNDALGRRILDEIEMELVGGR